MRRDRRMGLSVVAVCWSLGVAQLGSQDLPFVGPPAPPPAKDIFTVDQVIHPVVAKLPPPEFVDDIVSIPMAISSRSSLASRHVLQGLAYIQAAWDFEAYRHFCAAVKADPDCLMAYWGIGLALASPNNEFIKQRQIAVMRMIQLVDATTEVNGRKLPVASVMEQKYALALAELFALRGNGRDAFKKLSEDYPNNLQAKCLAIYLQRDGFDDYGPRPKQEAAMREMESVVKENPDNVGVLSFWAMLHAEAPEATTKLRGDILPLVRKAVRKTPDFPPYQHLLGHFEWRCGNHFLAEVALSRASDLYADHMKKHRLSLHECDGWIRSQLYLATAMYSRGRFEEAMEIASNLAKLEVDPARLGSIGANLLLWDAATLSARLYLARGKEGDFGKAIASLPRKDDPFLAKVKDRTLSVFYLECLMQYLECRKELEAGQIDAANKKRMSLSVILSQMKRLRDRATESSSISEYVRAFKGLEVYEAEARGFIALARATTDSQRQIARTWFKSAIEKQQRPSLLMPPVVVSPMEVRLAEFYTGTNNYDQAAASYQAAIRRRPNDLVSLRGYRDSLMRIGRKDEAAEVDKIISAVKK
ncbi:MAG: hypothetical protein MK194_08585 [Roseibacillus sp.]|nr:hypothetical protein [Roseibacillus sp.]